MRRILAFSVLLIGVIGVVFTVVVGAGLPMRELRLPDGVLIGAVDDLATDMARPDLFSGAPYRAVPFQMLYPARTHGGHAFYVPDAGPLIDATVKSHGWMSRVALGQMGELSAAWTDAAEPSAVRPLPVVIYLPGVTGYMQMGSFQTIELAARDLSSSP